MAIAYEELEGSPSITMDRDGGSGRRTFKIAWSDIGRAILEIFPGARFGYPYTAAMPGFKWLRAMRMSIDPWDASHPTGTGQVMNTYPNGAKIVVDYEPYKWPDPDYKDGPGDPENVTFLEQRLTFGGEYLTFPNNAVQWATAADGGPIIPGVNDKGGVVFEDINVGVVIPTIEHSMTWNFVRNPPWAGIRNCLGKVNKSVHMNCQPETLLFNGCTAERTYSTQGSPTWKLDYRISEKCYNYPIKVRVGAQTPTVTAGGANYKIDDILFFSGGTGEATTVVVTAITPAAPGVNFGAVTAVKMGITGAYSVRPANPNSVTGGGTAALPGAGATIRVKFNVPIVDEAQGWNHFLRPGSALGSEATFQRMRRKRSSDGVYLKAEFRQLYGGRP